MTDPNEHLVQPNEHLVQPNEHLVQPDRTLDGYERWAASYDALDNPLVAATAWVLDLAPLDLANRDLLELGCGTGRHAHYALAHDVHSYTGVDGSPAMLAVARARTADPRVTWLEADLRQPWQPTRTYDVALVVLVLEHLTELSTLASTLARAVSPGGTLRILDLHPDRITAGSVAHFQDGETLVKFASVAHPISSICAALEAANFTANPRTWLADEDLISAVPRLAKHRSQPIATDITAVRR